MCEIEGCNGLIVAKGLCAKHYMRQRRYGSPHAHRKSGSKPRKDYAVPADLFAEWSPSTQARYRKTHRMMSVLGQEPSEQAIKAATCLNGSLNVSRLVDIVSYTFSRRAS
jgi:hypothetical protein